MRYGLLLTACLCCVSMVGLAAPVAFDGAEGAGRFAVGGRGGVVYEVTNLNNSGPGSIVDAVSAGSRTIVFRVSGTIELRDVILRPKSYTTIAGQTAPGDGICLKGRIYIGDVSDVIIRYLRVRVDEGGANSSGDAIDIAGGEHIIIDHVSASYARDETISCQDGSNHVTVQWCILSEALAYESHSYGSLIRGEYGEQKTYHHNLYAHNHSRNPRPGNYTSISSDPQGLYFDFRNNVVYNWLKTVPGYGDSSNCLSRYNFINNVYLPGPESTNNGYGFRELSSINYGYFSGNMYNDVVPADPWRIVLFDGLSTSEIAAYKARSYLVPMEPVTTTSAAQAKVDVLAGAGASLPVRDVVDLRIVNDVINRTGHSIENTSDLADPWPTLGTLPASADGDHDGMPDAWELTYGFSPANAADRNGYDLHAEYTNLEVYLAWLCSPDALNEAPKAHAGADQVTWGLGQVVQLDGTTSDDGPYVVTWRQVENGAPAVVIDPADAEDAAVTIAERGDYEFVLTADDGRFQISDTVRVVVGEDSCDASHLMTGMEYHAADANRDCIVNLQDLMMLFAESWLSCTDQLTFCGG